MPDSHNHDKVESRNEPFVDRTVTRIWKEMPSDTNPYVSERALCHGFDLIELVKEKSFSEVFFLLFKGELPNGDESEILESLMISLINPGPRHPATRAAMNAGVGKSQPSHILPIAISVLGGEFVGGSSIERAMRFFRKNHKRHPESVVCELLENGIENENNFRALMPGFGRIYGGVDMLSSSIAAALLELKGAGVALRWGHKVAELLDDKGFGWLSHGIAAAVFSDLGFHPRAGVCLYQLLCAPGLAAHGLELANKPITAMPYVSDENYVIQR